MRAHEASTGGESAAVYPRRDASYWQQFLRAIFSTGVGRELTQAAKILLLFVFVAEQASGFARPVSFFDCEILMACGIRTLRGLRAARHAARNWLHHTPSAKGRPGLYWTRIPADVAGDNTEEPCACHLDPVPAADGEAKTSRRSAQPNPNGKRSRGRVAVGEIVSQAEQLYMLYPRHVGKAAAMKAIQAALKIASFETLREAVEAYAAARQGEDQQFTPFAATWFRRQSWLDDRAEWRPRKVQATRAAADQPGFFDGLKKFVASDGGELGDLPMFRQARQSPAQAPQ